jgi:hypothetical protein
MIGSGIGGLPMIEDQAIVVRSVDAYDILVCVATWGIAAVKYSIICGCADPEHMNKIVFRIVCGGSALDVAKMIALMHGQTVSIWNVFLRSSLQEM